MMAFQKKHPQNNSKRYGIERRDFLKYMAVVSAIPFVDKPGSPVINQASFIVESGRPGAKRA